MQSTGSTYRVLVVDDDPHGLNFFRASLSLSAYEVVTASSVSEAQQKCKEFGLQAIHVILTDFRMPRQTGLELVNWVRATDDMISLIILTAQGEKELVKQSMAAGVQFFLEKPVTHEILRDVVQKAITRTLQQRKYNSDRIELQAASAWDHSLNEIPDPQLEPYLKVQYKPLHELGGDFFNAFAMDARGSCRLLAGDFSGHDLRSGYASAYFQGMFRGFLEANADREDAFRAINRILHSGKKPAPSAGGHLPSFSLSMVFVEIDRETDILRAWNFGFPPFYLIGQNGKVLRSRTGNPPLGWFAEVPQNLQEISIAQTAFIYIFSDGIFEYAESLGIDPLCLLYVITAESPQNSSKYHSPPNDDILVLKYHMNPATTQNTFEPIISEQYSGSEALHIDDLQSIWRRSVQYALDDQMGDRLYEFLICIREGMLNALEHGCDGSAEKFCHLEISINHGANTIRVRIDDPGRGHQFKNQMPLEITTAEDAKHLGLNLIRHLSDGCKLDNNGATLIFDFKY